MHELDKIVIEHLQAKYQKAYTGYIASLAIGFSVAGIGIVQAIAVAQQNEGMLALSNSMAMFLENTFSIAMKNPAKDFAFPGCTFALGALSSLFTMPFFEKCRVLKKQISEYGQRYDESVSQETKLELENNGYLSEEQLNALPHYLPVIKKEDWPLLSKEQRVLYKYLYMDSKQAVDAYRERFGLDENRTPAEKPESKPQIQ